ncbi:MAG: methyltransferase, partial [Pseudomonadota bacterium]
NPPFFAEGSVQRPTQTVRDRANVQPQGALDVWVRFMVHALRPGGTATLIHRADALAELLACFENRFGGLIVRPILPRANASAHRILVTGIKGARSPLSISPPLVLHEADGSPTSEVAAILNDGAPLRMRPQD